MKSFPGLVDPEQHGLAIDLYNTTPIRKYLLGIGHEFVALALVRNEFTNRVPQISATKDIIRVPTMPGLEGDTFACKFSTDKDVGKGE
jgi:hypothetical protein